MLYKFIYKWRYEIASVLAGIGLTLSFSPFDYVYLAPISLAVIFLFWLECSPTRAALRGFAYGLGLFASGIYWVYISVHDYGGASILGATVLTILVVCFWSLCPALTAYIACKLAGNKHKNRRIWLLPFVWIFIEYLRGTWFLNGFPWLQIAYTQLQTPLKGYVPVVGAYGTGFLLALTASILVAGCKKQIPYKRVLLPIIILWGGGGLLQSVQWTAPIGDKISVALIQGNIPQDQKWLPQNRIITLLKYQQLTEQHWDKDIIIWPESAIPADLSQVKDNYLANLSIKATKHNTDLIVGIPVVDKHNQYFNAVLTLGKQQGHYYKNHLLPFGEYLPLQPVSTYVLKLLNIQLGNFTAGDYKQDLLKAGGYPFATSICYEDAFASVALNTLPEATFLVNVTNDAWFGDSIEPHQHMQLAQMRALETGRYMLRTTNTGITAIVAPDGLIINKAPHFKQSVLTGHFSPMGGMTFYARLGDEFIIIVLVIIFVGVRKIRLKST